LVCKMEKATIKTIAHGPVSVKCGTCGAVMVIEAKAQRETVQKATRGVFKTSITAEKVTTLEAVGTFGAPEAPAPLSPP
jgi:hypothetical protein